MEAVRSHKAQESDQLDRPATDTAELAGLTMAELDRRIRAGWDEWCDLLDGLVGTGGMLPPRELAAWVVAFFEDAYWRAEGARVEALSRWLAAEGLHRHGGLDRDWGTR